MAYIYRGNITDWYDIYTNILMGLDKIKHFITQVFNKMYTLPLCMHRIKQLKQT